MSDIAEFLLERISDTEHTCDLWAREAGVDPTGYLTAMLRRSCAATRRIVEQYLTAFDVATTADPYDADYAAVMALEKVLKALAYIHADHPDFRPEWAVTEEQQ